MDNTRLAFLALIGLALLAVAIAMTLIDTDGDDTNDTQDETQARNGESGSSPGNGNSDEANNRGSTPTLVDLPDDARLRVSHELFHGLTHRDVEAIVESMSDPLRKASALMLVGHFQRIQLPQLPVLLQVHEAEELLGVQTHPVPASELIRDWDERFPDVQVDGLLTQLFELDFQTERPFFGVGEGANEFEMKNPLQRGDMAWTEMHVEHEGETRHVGYHRVRQEGDTWRVVSFHPAFDLMFGMAFESKTESPANYDAWAQRHTVRLLHTVGSAYAAAAQDGEAALPRPGEDGDSEALLGVLEDALGDSLDEFSYEAVRDGKLVDAWYRPLRYEVLEGDDEGEQSRLVLRSAGFDDEFGTDTDLFVELSEAFEPVNPQVELDIMLPGEDEVRTVRLELFEDEVPNSARNFLNLVADGFYDGTKFHRIIEGFMVQGGDPYTRTGEGEPGTGNAGYRLPDEISGREFDAKGLLAYANSGPNSSSCQFFVTLGPQPQLNDGFNQRQEMRSHYTIIGRVVEGMEHIEAAGAVEVRRPHPQSQESRPVEDVHLVEARIVGDFQGPYAIRDASFE